MYMFVISKDKEEQKRDAIKRVRCAAAGIYVRECVSARVCL